MQKVVGSIPIASTLSRKASFGDVAQFGRAPALQAEGRRFEAGRLHFEYEGGMKYGGERKEDSGRKNEGDEDKT